MLKFFNAIRAPFAPGLLALATCLFVPGIGLSCPSFSLASPYFGPVTAPSGISTLIGRQMAVITDASGNATFYFFSANGSLLGSQSVGSNCFSSQTPEALRYSAQAAAARGVASSSTVTADFNGDGSPDVAVSDGMGNVLVYLSQGGGLQLSATYPAGNAPASLAAADVNGDGIQDLVVANFGSSTISVLLGVHGGTFQNAVNYPAGGHPVSLALGDVNSDGARDIVVGLCGATTCTGASAKPGSVAVLAGKGDGTFASATVVKSGIFPLSLLLADFTGDGQLDIAVGDYAASGVTVLTGNGSGAFAASTTFGVAAEPDFIGYGDFNNDGIPDLVVLNTSGGLASILYGQGSGRFGAATAYAAANTPTIFAIADFNADGQLDLALQDLYTGNLEFVLGHNGGTFLAPRGYLVDPGPALAAAGDFNGDGFQDFILASRQSGTLTLFLGAGGGSFYSSLSVNLPPGITPTALATGDFNNDGKRDLLVGTTVGLYILLGSETGFAAPQEASLSGGIATVSPIGIAVADYNGDGKPDLAILSGSTSGGATLGVYSGNGNGTFTSLYVSTYTTILTPSSIAAPDLNGDGKADLVILDAGGYNPSTATNVAGAVNVLLNSSSGTAFATPVAYSAGTSPFSVVTADFNKDGKADVALISFSGQGDGSVALLTGDGAGKLNTASFSPLDNSPQAIVTSDFNGDGQPDVIVSTGVGLDVLLNNGSGGFRTRGQVPAGPSPQGIAVADFNGDGKPDLAIAAAGTGTSVGYAILMMNRAVTPAAPIATVNAASFAPNAAVAPLSIVSTFGSGLASQTLTASSLTTSLGGTSVSVTDSTGTTRAANIFFVSPGQVNYEIPGSSAIGVALFAVQKNGTTVASGFVEIAMVGPGVFSADGRLAAGGLIHVDSSNNQTPGDIVQCASGVCTAVPVDVSASAGKTFLILYGTGIRGAALSQVSAQAGGVPLKVDFAGGQGAFAGLDQVNVELPASLQGAGDVAVSVTAAGVTSNAVHITIQ